MRLRLRLVQCGVPFDVAFTLDHRRALAWVVALGEMDGASFDWAGMRWKPRR